VYIREDQADIRVSIDGVPYGDSWYSYEGAILTKDVSKTRPGGMGSEVAVGGQATREDVTCTIQFTDVVAGWHKRLESLVSRDTRAKVALNWLGPDKMPIGVTDTVVGVLASAQKPNVTSESGEVSFYTIVVSLDEQAA
jgi:hypothetical protein